MLDSLKILVNGETETMECFVGNVSASVLPERIFSVNATKAVRSVCVMQTDYLLYDGSVSSAAERLEKLHCCLPNLVYLLLSL